MKFKDIKFTINKNDILSLYYSDFDNEEIDDILYDEGEEDEI